MKIDSEEGGDISLLPQGSDIRLRRVKFCGKPQSEVMRSAPAPKGTK